MTWIGLYQRRGHEVTTSEQIATSVNTNPVVIRRLLGELRQAGLADSRRGRLDARAGPGGDHLLGVYQSIEPGPVFALHRATPTPNASWATVVGRNDRRVRRRGGRPA